MKHKKGGPSLWINDLLNWQVSKLKLQYRLQLQPADPLQIERDCVCLTGAYQKNTSSKDKKKHNIAKNPVLEEIDLEGK